MAKHTDGPTSFDVRRRDRRRTLSEIPQTSDRRRDARNVLFVCTGNICRSALAELLLKDRMRAYTPLFPLTVASAGTRAVVDGRIPPLSLAEASALGIDGTTHRGRLITSDIISASDLILTMTREHRARVVASNPASLKRTFTLLEFARLSSLNNTELLSTTREAQSADPAERFRERVTSLHHLRGPNPAASHEDDDIADPFGGYAAAHKQAAAQITATLPALLTFLSRP